MSYSVSWTCYLLLVMMLIYHARATDDAVTGTSEDDPDSVTPCCVIERHTLKCCSEYLNIHIDYSLVKRTGIVVISTCAVLAILVLVCCFWGRCPLYNTCRSDYGQTAEVPYEAKEDHPLTGGDMPLMSGNGQHGYNVSIRPVEEV